VLQEEYSKSVLRKYSAFCEQTILIHVHWTSISRKISRESAANKITDSLLYFSRSFWWKGVEVDQIYHVPIFTSGVKWNRLEYIYVYVPTESTV